jgi:hypothetical protein
LDGSGRDLGPLIHLDTTSGEFFSEQLGVSVVLTQSVAGVTVLSTESRASIAWTGDGCTGVPYHLGLGRNMLEWLGDGAPEQRFFVPLGGPLQVLEIRSYNSSGQMACYDYGQAATTTGIPVVEVTGALPFPISLVAPLRAELAAP